MPRSSLGNTMIERGSCATLIVGTTPRLSFAATALHRHGAGIVSAVELFDRAISALPGRHIGALYRRDNGIVQRCGRGIRRTALDRSVRAKSRGVLAGFADGGG